MMQRISSLAVLMIVWGVADMVSASDHTGIYAVIEDITHTSPGTPDETVRVRGIFSLAKDRNAYKTPVYGYMLFRLKKGEEVLCRKEWADLKRVAGTGQVIAFSRRFRRGTRKHAALGRVYKLSEKPTKPNEPLTEYSSNIGIQKIRGSMDYLPHRQVACFPTPSSPVEGAEVKAGQIKLVVRNAVVKEKQIEYFFEIETSDKRVESSFAVEPGKKETSWTPKMSIAPGQKYTWRAWTVLQWADRRTGKTASWKSPISTVQFVGTK
jgi:hypothetical protein